MTSPSQASAERWNRTLAFFRFHFAAGGHANDADELTGSVRFTPGEAGLVDLFERLGVALQRIPEGMPRRALGRAYTAAEWDAVAHPIDAYPAFASPAFVRIEGMPVHLSVHADRVRISVSGAGGDPWIVGTKDYRNALALEALLPGRGVRFCRIASRAQIERVFEALQSCQLPDLETHTAARRTLVAKGGIGKDAADPALDAYAALRCTLGAEYADDEVWQDAHREIQGLRAAAMYCHADARLVARRCPGFSAAVIERVCADARFALR